MLTPTIPSHLMSDAVEIRTLVSQHTITDAVQYADAADTLKHIKGMQKDIDEKRKSMTRPIDAAKQAVIAGFRPIEDELAKAEAVLKAAMVAFTVAERQRAEQARREAEEVFRAAQREAEAQAAEARRQAALEAEAVARQAREQAEARRVQAAEKEDADDAATAALLRASADGIEERAVAQIADLLEVADAPPVVVPVPTPVIAEPVKAKGIAVRKHYGMRVVDAALVPRQFLEVNEAALRALAASSQGTAEVPGVEFYVEDVIAARGIR